MRRLLPTVALELSPFIYGIELLCKRRCYSLKYLDTSTNGIHAFRNPRALSSALAALGTLQPRALGFLKRVDPSVSVSNLYIYRKSGNFHVQNISCLKISCQNIFIVAGRPRKFPPVFMFLYVGIRTYVLARAMACDCSEVDRDPFGSGKPFLGLKKLRIDI